MNLYRRGVTGCIVVGQETRESALAKLGLVGLIALGFAGFILYAVFFGTRPGVRIIRR